MIEQVINLGIKGSELVAQKLKEVQKQKELTAKKANVKLGSTSFGEALRARREERKSEIAKGQELKTYAERHEEKKTETPKPEKKEESDYSKNLKSEMQGARSQAASSIQNFNGTGLAQAGVMGLSALGGGVGTMIGQSLNYVIDAVVAFKDKMKQQAQIVADTASKNNDIYNKLGKQDFSSITKRGDINKSEQASIVNSISSSMGTLTKDFQESLGKVFMNNGKAVDTNQATSLAQGNFSALGNDKGFFMQQISSGFGGLPPSMKQALTSQMFGMLDKDDLFEQKDAGIRGQMNRFDSLDRSQAQKYVGDKGQNIDRALDIQKLTYDLDMMIAKGMSKMIDKVSTIAKSPDINAAMMAEFKGAVSDLKNSIMGVFRR